MKHRKETITAVLFFLLLAMGLCYISFLFLSGQSALRKELGKLRRDPGYVLEFVEQAESALNATALSSSTAAFSACPDGGCWRT